MTEFDVRLFRLFYEVLSQGSLWPMVVFSAIGGGWGALVVLPLLVASRTRRFAGALSVVLAVTAVIVFVLKRLVARVRPYGALEGVQALFFEPPTDFSFPSGHSAGSFAFAVFVALVLVRGVAEASSARERIVRRVAAALLLFFAVGVGLSRIALGVHFPGDVLAGALLGTVIATVGAHVHLARSRRWSTRDDIRDASASP